MQSHSMPRHNEFAEAPLADGRDDGPPWFHAVLPPVADLRRVLRIVPLAIFGYLAFWFVFLEPLQPAVSPLTEARSVPTQQVLTRLHVEAPAKPR
jgi:hypothetical protein